MKVCKTIVKIATILIISLLSLTITVFAYYQYFGKYSGVVTLNGKIKIDAFDVLYDNLRSKEHGYGTTPENPFVIDNVKRLNNLILLNNDGRLQETKDRDGIDKYYFCLEFDQEELPQVLNLINEELTSIGNNEHPFTDELAGIVYGYPIEMNDGTTEYVFYSGCAKKALVSTRLNEETGLYELYEYEELSTHTMEDFGITDPATFKPTEYIFLDKYYDESVYANNNRKISFINEEKVIPVADLTICHQVIANETIYADDEQIDVGFISSIGETGYVHDIILYNQKIVCKEEEPKGVFNKLISFFSDLTDHIFAKEDKSDERHIGFFAGHIDGAANNISIAGSSSFDIDTKSVNYYSDFTTVGYINPNAIINNVPFASLYSENANQGNSWGCLFADNIYELVKNDETELKDQDNSREYVLKDISADTAWPGVDENNQFVYGSFNFILSNNNDTLNKIWSGDDGFYFLNKNGYNINTNVLYSTAEYRFTDAQTAGGTLLNVSASLGEKVYAGVKELDNTGAEIDAGKYAIIAKVADSTKDGGYAYYALKIAASSVNGNVVYEYDHTDAIDVTNYITGSDNNIFSSAIWEVPESTSKPKFQNSRFNTNWFGVIDGEIVKADSKATAHEFEVNTENHSIYYKEKDESTGEMIAHYLNFDKDTMSFVISNSKESNIYLYYISNGFTLQEVQSVNDLELTGKYVIIAKSKDGSNNDTYNLLGLNANKNDNGFVVDRTINPIDYDLGNSETHILPPNISLLEYETIRPYIWELKSNNGTAYSFVDEISNSIYLANDAGTLAASTNATMWTYAKTTNGSTLRNNNQYISYQEDNDVTKTNYSLNVNAYDLLLYRLIPDNSDPLYITYEAARYLKAESTTVPAGNYAIIAEHGTTNSAITLSNSTTTISAQTVNIANGVTDNNYLWNVAENSATPSFKNVGRNRYLNQTGGNTPQGSSSELEWMYDATTYRLFYKNGNDYYYLVWNTSTNKPAIVQGLNQANSNYSIKLYLCETRYTYENFKIATETYYGYNNNGTINNQTVNQRRLATYPENKTASDPYMYFLSSKPFNQDAEAPFLIGYRNADGQNIISSLNTTEKGYTYEDNTLTTTMDLSDYAWMHKWSTETSNNDNIRNVFFNYGYAKSNLTEINPEQKEIYDITNKNNKLYLGISNSSGSRSLTVSKTEVIGQSNAANTGFYILQSTVNSGFWMGFRGSSYYYNLYSEVVEGSFQVVSTTSNAPGSTNGIKGNGRVGNVNTGTQYAPVYMYVATGVTATPIATLLSSNGDTLDKDIHYMIAAKSKVTNDYYALSKVVNDDTISFTSEKVTNQFDTIMQVDLYTGSTMVPIDADWTQMVDGSDIRFIHTHTSTNSSKDYLDIDDNGNLIITNLASTATVETQTFNYDIVNKLFKYTANSNSYYLVYNEQTATWSFTTTKDDASKIHLIRYSPTYNVKQVTNYSDKVMADGEFIISGHSGNGYNAIGTTGTSIVSMDITNYLNDELSENDYNKILDYVWTQRYYDYVQDSDYEDDVSGGYVQVQLLAKSGKGGIAGIKPSGGSSELQSFTSTYTWKFTRQNDGTWKVVNNQSFGSTTANSISIKYSDKASTNLTILEHLKMVDRYVGTFTRNNNLNNGTSNIYLYLLNGTKYTGTPVENSNYYIVMEATSAYTKKVILTFDGTNFAYEDFDINKVNTYQNTNKYKFTSTDSSDTFKLKNGTKYIYIDGSSFTSSSTEPNNIFKATNGVLTNIKAYYPSANSNNSISTSNTGKYSIKLYSYTTRDNKSFNLTSLTGESNSVLAIFYNNTNYYYITTDRNNNLRFTQINNPTIRNGQLTNINIDLTNENNYNRATFTVTVNDDGLYNVKNKNSRSINISNTNVTIANNSNYYPYDSNKGLYFEQETSINYSFTESIGSTTTESTGAKVIVYKQTTDGYEAATELVQGEQYIIFIGKVTGRQGLLNTYDYYLLNYEGNNTLGYKYVGNEITGYESLITANSYISCGALGEYGIKLYFTNASTKYLTLSSGSLAVNSTGQYFECSYDPVYIDDSRLYTLKDPSYVDMKFSAEGQSFMTTDSSTVNTLLIKLTKDGDIYKNDGILTSSTVSSGSYAIGVYQDNKYYFLSVNENGDVVPVTYGAGIPTTFGSAFAWASSGTTNAYKFNPVSDNTKFLQTDGIGKLVLGPDGDNAKMKYSATADNGTTKFSAADQNSGSNLYVFKVSKSDSLDLSSDTKTTINYKMEVQASLSVLDSTKYIIVSYSNGKYYALSVVDPTTTKALDITDTFKNAYEKEGTITLFDASVWNQIGTDYNLMFDSMGFAPKTVDDEEVDDYYLLTGSYANRVGKKPSTYQTASIPDDTKEYNWKIFEVGNEYVIGYEDKEKSTTSYIYFDNEDLTFKLTENINTALGQHNITNLYELGKELETVPAQTFEIALKSDGQTIESFPLNTIEANEMAKYNDIQTSGRISKNVPGEYLITTYYNDRYYALTLNDDNEVEFIDVTLYFSGNFILNDAKYYCLSISQNYLWQQLNEPTFEGNTASNLKLLNIGKNVTLDLNGSDILTFDGIQLYSANGYLTFGPTGYGVSTTESTIPIVIYTVGTGHVATGGSNTDLEYVYFTKGLSTYGETGVDFGAFNFSEKVISELPNYAMSYDGEKIWEYKVNATDEVMQEGILLTRQVSGEDFVYFTESGESATFQDGKVVVGTNVFTTYADYIVKIDDQYYAKDETTVLAEYHGTNRSSGTLGYTIGWDKNGDSVLTDVNSIVYFKDGIKYNNNVATFRDEFIAESRDYSVINEETNDAYVGTVNYFAPKGSAAFFIPQATKEAPVLVNVMVSTKLDTTQFDINKLRYLALWKAADFDAAAGTLKTVEQYETGDGTTIEDYAYSLAKGFDTPYAAIPLANHYGAVNTASPGSGASYVKVGSNGYNLSALKDAEGSWDHLVAHTFLISEPGVYYMGSTYGSVSFAYVSISDVYLAEAGEDDADTMDQGFSIDYVWGDIATDASACQNGDDSSLGDIAYVGKLAFLENNKPDVVNTWVNSNIYPEFKNGTNGLAGGTNPTDYLTFKVQRVKTNVEDQNGNVVSIISSVNIEVHTLERIDDNGNGFMYRNMNTVTQRKTRKVEFEIILDE